MSKIAWQFCALIFKQGVLPPTEKLTLSIFPTPAGRVKSPLIRRFGEETAMGTYLKYARHRSFSPKPPSERQFDRPRQKLASLVSGDYKKRGVAPFGDWLCQFLLSPSGGRPAACAAFLPPSRWASAPRVSPIWGFVCVAGCLFFCGNFLFRFSAAFAGFGAVFAFF